MNNHASTKALQTRSRTGLSRLDGLGNVILNFRDQGLDVATISRMVGCSRAALAKWLESDATRHFEG